MTALIVIKPVAITDAMLTDTDVTEADYAAYSAVTTYALGDRVIVVATHKIYESLQASNLNHDPTLTASAAWWLEVSPTNRWKLFDTSSSTQTSKATSMYYTITPGMAFDGLAALNVSADSVRIRVTDPTEGLVYDQTTNLIGAIPAPSWYDYLFGTVNDEDRVIALDLPPYPAANVRVDFAAASGNVSCGVLLLGYQVAFGEGIELGARGGILDYSRKETNSWGDRVLTQGAWADRADWTIKVPRNELNSVRRSLVAFRATPCLWVGHDEYDMTSIFGFYREFDISINYVTHADCTLSLEGMT